MSKKINLIFVGIATALVSLFVILPMSFGYINANRFELLKRKLIQYEQQSTNKQDKNITFKIVNVRKGLYHSRADLIISGGKVGETTRVALNLYNGPFVFDNGLHFETGMITADIPAQYLGQNARLKRYIHLLGIKKIHVNIATEYNSTFNIHLSTGKTAGEIDSTQYHSKTTSSSKNISLSFSLSNLDKKSIRQAIKEKPLYLDVQQLTLNEAGSNKWPWSLISNPNNFVSDRTEIGKLAIALDLKSKRASITVKDIKAINHWHLNNNSANLSIAYTIKHADLDNINLPTSTYPVNRLTQIAIKGMTVNINGKSVSDKSDNNTINMRLTGNLNLSWPKLKRKRNQSADLNSMRVNAQIRVPFITAHINNVNLSLTELNFNSSEQNKQNSLVATLKKLVIQNLTNGNSFNINKIKLLNAFNQKLKTPQITLTAGRMETKYRHLALGQPQPLKVNQLACTSKNMLHAISKKNSLMKGKKTHAKNKYANHIIPLGQLQPTGDYNKKLFGKKNLQPAPAPNYRHINFHHLSLKITAPLNGKRNNISNSTLSLTQLCIFNKDCFTVHANASLIIRKKTKNAPPDNFMRSLFYFSDHGISSAHIQIDAQNNSGGKSDVKIKVTFPTGNLLNYVINIAGQGATNLVHNFPHIQQQWQAKLNTLAKNKCVNINNHTYSSTIRSPYNNVMPSRGLAKSKAVDSFTMSTIPLQKCLTSATSRPLVIQVIKLHSNYLFIYPQQGIASLNTLTLPKNQRVRLLLTSESPKSLFVKPLINHIVAIKTLRKGPSFPVKIMQQKKFKLWLSTIKNNASDKRFTHTTYTQLKQNNSPAARHKAYYATVNKGLFNSVVHSCIASRNIISVIDYYNSKTYVQTGYYKTGL
jgi:hypothetical protein